jgi:hypothetical protein
MSRHSLATFTLLAFVACGGGTSKDGTGTGTATGTGTGTGGGTGGGGGATAVDSEGGGGASGWEPVAVGFELIAGINEDNVLGPFTSTDSVAPFNAVPFVVLTLASIDYFSGSTDESCEMLALIVPEDGLPDEFDFRYPSGDDHDVLTMAEQGASVGWDEGPESASPVAYATWSGRLLLDPLDDNCTGIIDGPETWFDAPGAAGSEAYEPFQNMRIAFQIAQHTDYLLSGWTTTTDAWDTYGNAMMAEYICVNRPEGNFECQDWTTARFWEVEDESLKPVVDGDYLVPSTAEPNNQPAGTELPLAYINGNARWYEDFVRLDFTNLAD